MKAKKTPIVADQVWTPIVGDKGWTPIRRGEFYCSPRCGAKCTHEAFLTAGRKATKLAKSLGEGWTPRVWENMGWFYAVQKGVAEMHVNEYKKTCTYTLYFNASPQMVTSGESPEAALQETKKRVGRLIFNLQNHLEAIR